ncbi:MAG: zinc ribbon domain-containing protein [Methanothermobacter tenebrarum]
MKKLYIILGVISLFSFLLPWAYVVVEGDLDMSELRMSGIDLIFGKTASLNFGVKNMWTGELDIRKMKVNDVSVILAFILTLVMLFLIILTKKPSSISKSASIISILCIILLLISLFAYSKYRIKSFEIQRECLFGFWLAFISYLGILLVTFLSKKGDELAKIPIIGEDKKGETKSSRFCSQCGAQVSLKDIYCPSCGAKLELK